ncbi:MAG: UxaA family hydrolase [Verrucomicrobia bacterium]|nr:UxaA family hydrolase [Verrucomicrobiota bacterium]
MVPRCFQIHPDDNVATALDPLPAGPVQLLGESAPGPILATGPTQTGHKIAVLAMEPGDPVRKFGSVIGEATKSIRVGDWVHLHNMKSRLDERSNTLDASTGAPTEGGVYV